MLDFNVFKGGKRHAVTFSYDDGNYEGDKKLIEKLNAHGAKGTFHLNSMYYRNSTEEYLDELRKMYEGHEIAAHAVHHAFLDRIPKSTLINEVFEDRRNLEKIFGCIVSGLSYPFGTYNEEIKEVLRNCGIVYSRTVDSTQKFTIPSDFLAWHPTCHHKKALERAEEFVSRLDGKYSHMLFYIWGHAAEFNKDDNWDMLDELLDKICGLDNVWYATNIEIYNYKMAQKQLLVSADETIIHNPTDTEVCVRHGDSIIVPLETITIKPGETVKL
jgi:peptidoglycan/xylan/chitin deacetylase (PgdA/CDA1 family)